MYKYTWESQIFNKPSCKIYLIAKLLPFSNRITNILNRNNAHKRAICTHKRATYTHKRATCTHSSVEQMCGYIIIHMTSDSYRIKIFEMGR